MQGIMKTTMKKLVFSLLVTLTTLAASAQKDVTKFLGIPVDGTKAEMIQELKAKGFTSTSYDREVLKGVFNGRNVNVHIVTNGSKVWRIMVADAISQDETNIRIRFNKLCKQFESNSKYMSLNLNQSISEDEDIAYNILVHKKRYEASYYQQPEEMDTTTMRNELFNLYLSKYTKEQLERPTSAIQKDLVTITSDYLFDKIISKKSVWFMISKDMYSKYSICMYYDNLYNQANGEDL